MIEEIKNVKETVRKVLTYNIQSRSDDKVLMIDVWEHEGLFLSPAQKLSFMKCSHPESIRRTRQKFQEEGLYPATPEVKEARAEEEKTMRELF